MHDLLLTCEGLRVSFPGNPYPVIAVDNAAFVLRRGRVLGVVGESGSGKSQMFMALTGLTPAAIQGQVIYGGLELISAAEPVLQKVRGSRIAYIFQDPMTALNPYLRISTQLAEVARAHLGLSRAEANQRALDMLTKVRIPDAARGLRSFPHELSGGMRQRVMIAMAIMAGPEILIADEPTTALDAIVQIQILDLLRDLCETEALAIVLITHDMSVVARIADEVVVMYAGRIVEQGPCGAVLKHSRHPYTKRLMDGTLDLNRPLDEGFSGIPGQLPGPDTPREQCLFAERCSRAEQVCRSVNPALEEIAESHVAACHYPLSGGGTGVTV